MLHPTVRHVHGVGGGGIGVPPLDPKKTFVCFLGGKAPPPPPPPFGSEDFFFFSSSFFLSERLVMYDGYTYSVVWKIDPPPPPAHRLFHAWRGIDHGMHAMLTPPPHPPWNPAYATVSDIKDKLNSPITRTCRPITIRPIKPIKLHWPYCILLELLALCSPLTQ